MLADANDILYQMYTLIDDAEPGLLKTQIKVVYNASSELIIIEPYKIHMTTWDDINPDTQKFFVDLIGNDEAQTIYSLIFNGFVIGHELGHQLASKLLPKPKSFYDEEYEASRIGIMLWKEMGAQSHLNRIKEKLNQIKNNIQIPAPKKIDFKTFAVQNYDQIVKNEYSYAYMHLYQILQLLDQDLPSLKSFLKAYSSNLTVSRENN